MSKVQSKLKTFLNFSCYDPKITIANIYLAVSDNGRYFSENYFILKYLARFHYSAWKSDRAER